MIKRAAAVFLAAAALLLVSGALSPREASVSVTTTPPDRLAAGIERIQQRLKTVPGDWTAWAALGSSYVEQARVTGNPAFYPKAEAALNQSQRLRPNDVALTGMGALANSRHDFALAASLARQALELNGFSAAAYGVLADALTQLGQAGAASEAVQRMLDLDPGLPALSRAAYDVEQHGRVDQARDLWRRALRDAGGADAAFVHQQLGDLAWHEGDLAAAETEYRLARHRLGLARIHVARGEAPAALALYAELTAAQPTVSLLSEYAIVLAGDLHLLPGLTAPTPHTGNTAPHTGPAAPQSGNTAPHTGPGAPQDGNTAPHTGPAAPRTGPAALHTGPAAPQDGNTARHTGNAAFPRDAATAQTQLRLADAALALLAANGGTDDLAAAEVAIARGDYAAAVTLCEKEWQRRKHTDVADLLGWSLHLAGRDTEALAYAQKATALGIQHRDYTAHLGAIEESLK